MAGPAGRPFVVDADGHVFEPPLVGATRDATSGALLVTDSVLSLRSWVWREGVGGVLGRAVVRVTDGEPEVLSRLGSRWTLPR